MSQRALLPLLLILVAAKLALNHLADPDLFWHLRLGLDMLRTGELPATADYSWTLAGQPYQANDWLPEIVLAQVFHGGGFVLLSLFKAGLCATLVLLLYLTALQRNDGNARAAALAVFFATLVATSNFILRPVLFGMLCLTGVLYAIERLARGQRTALIAMPLLFAVWINTHGSWPVGLAAVAAFSAGVLVPIRIGRFGPREVVPAARPLAMLALPVSLAGLLVNPYGSAFLLRPFRLVGHRQDIAVFKEWSPVPLGDPSAWCLGAVLLLLLLVLLTSRRRIVHAELAFVVAASVMAASTALYHIVFAVAVTPLLAEHLSERISAQGLANRSMNAAVLLIAMLMLLPLCALSILNWRSDVRAAEPIDAVAALERLPQRQLRGFNYFDWGGYLVFRGIPSYIDGRLEPFIGNGRFARYLQLEQSGDIAALEAEGVDWALVRSGSHMAEALQARTGWHQAFADHNAELYVRDVPALNSSSSEVRGNLPAPVSVCQPWCEGLGG